MSESRAGIWKRIERLEQQRDALLTAAEAALAMFEKGHAIDKFNWRDSALDAAAITELNEVPLGLRRAIAAARKG